MMELPDYDICNDRCFWRSQEIMRQGVARENFDRHMQDLRNEARHIGGTRREAGEAMPGTPPVAFVSRFVRGFTEDIEAFEESGERMIEV